MHLPLVLWPTLWSIYLLYFQPITFADRRSLLLPLTDERDWSTTTRAVLYFMGLLYSFLGIAIAADVFMCAIERITSTKTKVRVVTVEAALEAAENDNISESGAYTEIRVWNPTVANLTLMALGSSAPEILLSCIEIIGNNFEAGDLGPGTIVGSAAFNLLIITGICIASIGGGESKRIHNIGVFIITAGCSVFAYLWLLFILKVTSPEVVEVWEGVMTLVFFVILVAAAYAADRRLFHRCFSKSASKRDGDAATDGEDAKVLEVGEGISGDEWLAMATHGRVESTKLREMERQIRLQYPGLSADDLSKMLAYRIKQAEPHDRMWYRIQATRQLSSSSQKPEYWDIATRVAGGTVSTSASNVSLPGVTTKSRVIEFSSRVYAINPNERRVKITVVRRGRTAKQMLFKYTTVNGVAEKNKHYLPKIETLRFEPGQTEKEISIELVDGADWKPKDVFYVHLEKESEPEESKTELGRCKVAEIVFLDPEQSAKNEVYFVKNHAAVEESDGFVRLPIRRTGDITQRVTYNYETEEQTAQDGADYEGGKFEASFDPWEIEKYVDIAIVDDMIEEKDETFAVNLSTENPGTTVGEHGRVIVTILSDDETLRYFRNMDRLVPRLLLKLTPGMHTWKEQILAAVSVNGGNLDDANMFDILLHVISFPWKVIFSLVPPVHYMGGWLTFVVALIMIGALTAIVGDLASIFGCLVGMKDTFTAITLVALGTSLPDTFASKLAAQMDKHADNAVGNVTGSNSVNVFLGLGLPWCFAAIYHSSKGSVFNVPSGTLTFSVMIYTVCSLICIGLLFARRYIGWFGKAELGGPPTPKYLSAAFAISLWFVYVTLSGLRIYDII